MKCEDIEKLLTQYLLGDLDDDSNARVQAHLDECEGCRAALQEIEPTLDLLRDALAATSPAAAGLSAQSRTHIMAQRKPSGRKVLWPFQNHPVLAAAAALLLVCFIFGGLLLPTLGRAYRSSTIIGSLSSDMKGVPVEIYGLRSGTEALELEDIGELNEGIVLEEAVHGPAPDPGGRIWGYRPTLSDRAERSGESGIVAVDPFAAATAPSADMPPMSAARPKPDAGTDETTRSSAIRHYGGAAATATEAGEVSKDKDHVGPMGGGLSPTPAHFDSLSIVQSPVTMKGVTANRPARQGGGEEEKLQAGARTEQNWNAAPEQRRQLDMGYTADVSVDDDIAQRKDIAGARSNLKPTEKSGLTLPALGMLDVDVSIELPEDRPALGPGTTPSLSETFHQKTKQGAGGDQLQENVNGVQADRRARTVDSDGDNRLQALVSRETLRRKAMPEPAAEQAQTESRGLLFARKPQEAAADKKTETYFGDTGRSLQGVAGIDAVIENEMRAGLAPAKKAAARPASPAPQLKERPVIETQVHEEKLAESPAFRAIADVGLGAAAADEADEKAASLVVAQSGKVAKAKAEDHKEQGWEMEEEPTGPRFKAVGVNPFVSAAEKPFSTFAIDVDTASYTLARNYMNRGELPPAESVRTEEFVNFFDYGYQSPERDTFRVYAEMAPSKYGHGLYLLKVGVKGRRLGREEQRQAVLTFLVDTSGSMNKPDRIGLVKTALRMLVDKLSPNDLVAIVQYDSETRLVLEHTPAAERDKIRAAIDALQCGGSTNLEEGMQRAYRIAAQAFAGGAENRVLLLSDGVANLGDMTAANILASVAAARRQGITCSVFGFGMGTYDDVMLESLANKGDGAYAFIDSEDEAKRIFVDDLAATLNTIATDVKIQVEFTPDRVKQYRQLGYENRQLKKEDFRNDAIDAGEVGSGQSVTALYELELAGYRSRGSKTRMPMPPVAVIRVRYRRVDTGAIEEIETAVTDARIVEDFDAADVRFRLAASVAEFAEILRVSPFAAGSNFEDVTDALRPVSLGLHLDRRVQELLRMVHSAGGMGRGQ